MSELITVDFKQGAIVSRRDLEKPTPVPGWRATKDPLFKEYVRVMTEAVHQAYENGDNWQRLIIVIQPDPEDDENCIVIWDQNEMSPEETVGCLSIAARKIESVKEIEPDEPV